MEREEGMASCTQEIQKERRVLDKSDNEELEEDSEVREIMSKWKENTKKGPVEKKVEEIRCS